MGERLFLPENNTNDRLESIEEALLSFDHEIWGRNGMIGEIGWDFTTWESGSCGGSRESIGLDEIDTSNSCDRWVGCSQGRDVGVVVIPVLTSDGAGRILLSSTVAVGSNRNLRGLLAENGRSRLAYICPKSFVSQLLLPKKS